MCAQLKGDTNRLNFSEFECMDFSRRRRFYSVGHHMRFRRGEGCGRADVIQYPG